MKKHEEIIQELLKILDEVLDYAMCMKMATGYTCGSEPNLLAVCRLVEKLKEDEENAEKEAKCKTDK